MMAAVTKNQEHEIASADESQDGQSPGVLCSAFEMGRYRLAMDSSICAPAAFLARM